MIPENQRLIQKRSAGGELTCIICPIGCRMTIKDKGDGSPIEVSGNRCKRGVAYALEEFSDPRRMVTATCALDGGELRRLPVKSSCAVPVDLIPAFLNAVYQLRVEAPVKSGQILAVNLADSGADLVAGMTIGAVQ